MKKRAIALLLAALLTLWLTACSEAEQAEASPESAEESISEVESEASSEPESEAEVSEEESSEPEPEPEPLEEEPEAEVQTIYPAQSSARQLNPSDITVYVKDFNEFTVSDFNIHEDVVRFADMINSLNLTPSSEEFGDTEVAFMVIRNDNEKFQYNLNSTQLLIDNDVYTISEQSHSALRELAGSPVCSTYAQWLVYMNPARVEEISYQYQAEQGSVVRGEGYFLDALDAVRWIEVERGSGERVTERRVQFTPGGTREDYFQIKLRFDNTLYYTLTFDNRTLYVESDDISFGCKYTMKNLRGQYALSLLRDAPAETINNPEETNPETAKPVIYLYPQKTQDVQVQLDFKGRLDYTYPTYNGGWNVTAQPDGTLTNKADSSTHYYLFWDGTPDRKDWDLSSGFVVKGSETEAFLQEKLPLLGLTPREYNDFITYWVPRMKNTPYNLITFSTTEYEQTAPLIISPAPDTILRVHMVYKPLEKPIELPQQQLSAAAQREGFTVVEWGGTRLDEGVK